MIAGRVINEMTAFAIVYYWDSPESKSDDKLKWDVVYLPVTNFIFTVRPEQFQTDMFGWTGSKKYAME